VRTLVRKLRSIRPKKPYVATPDQVRISRDADGANIEYAEENVSGVHLVLEAGRMAAMTDGQILETHNACIESMQASARSFEWVAVEVPPGTPQVKARPADRPDPPAWRRPAMPHHGWRRRGGRPGRDLHR